MDGIEQIDEILAVQQASEHDLGLAKELAGLTRPLPKQCWANSFRALYMPPLANRNAYYIEGWLVICDGQVPIDHGWLVVDGKIVDPTLCRLDFEYGPQFYFPVYRYSRQQLTSAVLRVHSLPVYPHVREMRTHFVLKGRDLAFNRELTEDLNPPEQRDEIIEEVLNGQCAAD